MIQGHCLTMSTNGTAAVGARAPLTGPVRMTTIVQVPKSPTPYEDLHARIVRALTRAVPAGMRSSIDDLAQTALLKLLRQGRDVAELSALRPSYLWRVVHSELIDELRRRHRRSEVGLDEAPTIAGSAADNVERIVAGRLSAEEVCRCLGLLPKSRRRAVSLYLVGHRVREVGELLGISRKQAENLVYRGMQDLRRHLSERGYGHDAA